MRIESVRFYKLIQIVSRTIDKNGKLFFAIQIKE